MKEETIPCKTCITYAICLQKDSLTCPLLDNYALFTYTGPSKDRAIEARDYLNKGVAQFEGLHLWIGNPIEHSGNN